MASQKSWDKTPPWARNRDRAETTAVTVGSKKKGPSKLQTETVSGGWASPKTRIQGTTSVFDRFQGGKIPQFLLGDHLYKKDDRSQTVTAPKSQHNVYKVKIPSPRLKKFDIVSKLQQGPSYLPSGERKPSSWGKGDNKEVKEVEKSCPDCETLVGPRSKFCRKCGFKFDSNTPDPSHKQQQQQQQQQPSQSSEESKTENKTSNLSIPDGDGAPKTRKHRRSRSNASLTHLEMQKMLQEPPDWVVAYEQKNSKHLGRSCWSCKRRQDRGQYCERCGEKIQTPETNRPTLTQLEEKPKKEESANTEEKESQNARASVEDKKPQAEVLKNEVKPLTTMRPKTQPAEKKAEEDEVTKKPDDEPKKPDEPKKTEEPPKKSPDPKSEHGSKPKGEEEVNNDEPSKEEPKPEPQTSSTKEISSTPSTSSENNKPEPSKQTTEKQQNKETPTLDKEEKSETKKDTKTLEKAESQPPKEKEKQQEQKEQKEPTSSKPSSELKMPKGAAALLAQWENKGKQNKDEAPGTSARTAPAPTWTNQVVKSYEMSSSSDSPQTTSKPKEQDKSQSTSISKNNAKPKVEEPKKEEPKKEEPKKEEPKKDEPKKEEPKKDEPKKEGPKSKTNDTINSSSSSSSSKNKSSEEKEKPSEESKETSSSNGPPMPEWRRQLLERKKKADAKIGPKGGSHTDYAWKISSKLHERIQAAQSHDFVSQTILGAMQKPRPKPKAKPFKSASNQDLAYHRELQDRSKTSGMNLAMFVKNAPNLKGGGIALPGLVGGRGGPSSLRGGRGGRGRGFKMPSAHRGTIGPTIGGGRGTQRIALPGMTPK